MTVKGWEKANDRLTSRHLESKLQQQCVQWFRWQYPRFEKLLFAVPNGGSRSKVEAGIMQAEGVMPGVADLILLLSRCGYNALCIEMKTEIRGSKQNDNQRAWQKAVEENGSKYVVCRTIDSFMTEVKLYMRDYDF